MTYVVTSFVFISGQFAGLGPIWPSYAGAAIVTLIIAALMMRRSA